MINIEAEDRILVFPTDLAMRKYEMDMAITNGYCSKLGHISFRFLLNYLRSAVLDSEPDQDSANKLLLRKKVVQIAKKSFKGGDFSRLTFSACEVVLQNFEKELAKSPEHADKILEWLSSYPKNHRLNQLSSLYKIWCRECDNQNIIHSVDLNQKVLSLLKNDRSKLPDFLKRFTHIVFRDIRFFSPFEEEVVLLLKHHFQVSVQSSLPPSYYEANSEILCQRIICEDQTNYWVDWIEDISDALIMNNPEILSHQDHSLLDFSHSAGTYGEIEDLARRIIWYMEKKNTPSYSFAIVVPNLSIVQDIIPHVFSRFGLEYYFRRGRPVLSSPCIKAFIGWISFPLNAERDILIDLIRHPSLKIDMSEDDIDDFFKDHSQTIIELNDIDWFKESKTLSGSKGLEILNKMINKPEDDFNFNAYQLLIKKLELLKDEDLPLSDFIDLLIKLLENENLRPEESHEHAITVINYEDAVGLKFDWIGFIGMNEGYFPESIKDDAIINTSERQLLYEFLESENIKLPSLIFPNIDVRLEQQRIYLLAALGMAQKQVFLSYSSVNSQGRDQMSGRFYRNLWMLSGWPNSEEMKLSLYDKWRIDRLPKINFLNHHFERQKNTVLSERMPMPGESFLDSIPRSLIRTEDESLCFIENKKDDEDIVDIELPSKFKMLAERVRMENERIQYLSNFDESRKGSIYTGHLNKNLNIITSWINSKKAFSPTDLEDIANCRYLFLINRMLKLSSYDQLDDFPSNLSRGKLMHDIFCSIYSRLAENNNLFSKKLIWAAKIKNEWILSDRPQKISIPLVRFDPSKLDEIINFTQTVATDLIEKAISKRNLLGHPVIWSVEREKLMQSIITAITYDVKTCLSENRYPALFEYPFDQKLGLSVGGVFIKGRIDRIDLIFDKKNKLSEIHVLDYKGASKKENNTDLYLEKIINGLDCQLPLYAFAAQKYFFDNFNTPELNKITKSGYIYYTERNLSNFSTTRKKSLISMNEPLLAEKFIKSLTNNINLILSGNFSIDPYHGGFEHYQSLLRNEPIAN